jgi:hypothetical protein
VIIALVEADKVLEEQAWMVVAREAWQVRIVKDKKQERWFLKKIWMTIGFYIQKIVASWAQ